jgi:hypothetical protein
VISAQFLLRAARVPLSVPRVALYIGGVADGLFDAGDIGADYLGAAGAAGRALTEK